MGYSIRVDFMRFLEFYLEVVRSYWVDAVVVVGGNKEGFGFRRW